MLFDSYEKTIEARRFKSITKGRRVRVWGAGTILQSEICQYLALAKCDFELFTIPREFLNDPEYSRGFDWGHDDYFYVISSVNSFKACSSMLLVGGLTADIDFISFRRLRRRVLAIEGDSRHFLPSIQSGLPDTVSGWDCDSVLHYLSKDAMSEQGVTKIELGVRIASTYPAKLAQEISLSERLWVHVNTTVGLLDAVADGLRSYSNAKVFVHCDTQNDISAMFEILTNKPVSFPVKNLVLVDYTQDKASSRFLAELTQLGLTVDKGLLHPYDYGALLESQSPQSDRLAQLALAAFEQREKPCPCVRYFPIIGRNGDLYHCHNFQTALESSGKNVEELLINRKKSELCMQCSAKGLHRLDRHLLNI